MAGDPRGAGASSVSGTVLLTAYIAATLVHVGWVLAHEPFSFDAWNVAVDTGARPFTVGNFLGYWWQQYTESNPRLGQPLTYLTYKLAYVAEVVLPLAFVAISLAVTVLGLGRWPWRRARDLALWAIAIGFAWFALPQIGRNLFCRAYAANYVVGAAVQLWFLVPLRLASTTQVTPGQAAAYAVFGVLAGVCNEHTGPAMLALLGGYAWVRHRGGERPVLPLAGAAGFALGFMALFFAPGQGSRYEGLATKVSLIGRVLQRGITGNLDILRDYVVFAAPVLGLIAIVLIASLLRTPADGDPDAAPRRRALVLIALALGFGVTVATTLFVSPKLGARFHIVGGALLLAGLIALVDATRVRGAGLAALVGLAVFASGYAVARTVPLFAQVSVQGAERMAALAQAPRHGVFVAEAWSQVDESWWFIGDDFRDVRKREMVATFFGLDRVVFRGYQKTAPLGMSGVRIAPRYWAAGATCPGEIDTFENGFAQGFDLGSLHRGAQASIAMLQRQLGPIPLERVEFEVEFAGAAPALPRPRLLFGRWDHGRYAGPVATIKRVGTTRVITLPPELAGTDREVYVLAFGGGLKRLGLARDSLGYVPWRRGVYWVLACDAAECAVIAATRHGA